ncbi:WD40 repeat domain-containing protein [Duganella qianjiadongensis]|uniref:WD40 repeat domain-containing protein n=1 Tax=Duganella qianjiadongensis TaxID=2692176 RepID=A0ABW9VR74_9BURK|nr:hypothetical protein [Duganella qianjiadongensis]MYM41928.1 hypothetical protein [Duganella qianjiadongensis]
MTLFNDLLPSDQVKSHFNFKKISSINISDSSYIAFQPNSDNIAVYFGNSDIEIWNWRNSTIVKKLKIPDNTDGILSSQKLVFSQNGGLLAACHTFSKMSSVVRIWETNNWKIIKDIEDPVPGNGCTATAFSPDGTQMALIGGRRIFEKASTIRVFNTNNWQEIISLSTVPFQPYLVKYSNDGENLLIAGAVRNAVVWQGPGPQPVFGNPQKPDGGYLSVINLEKKEITKIIQLSQVPDVFGALSTGTTSDDIYFAGGTGIEQINIVKGESVVIRKPLTGSIRTSFEYAKDGKFSIDLVSSRDVNWFNIKDENNNKLIYQSKKSMNCAALSPNNKFIATCENNSVSIFEINK